MSRPRRDGRGTAPSVARLRHGGSSWSPSGCCSGACSPGRTCSAGCVVAAVVLIVFPLPPVTFAGRPRPVALATVRRRFVADLVAASVQVAALAFRFGHQPRSAIIRVPLRVHSDLDLTLTGEAVSLVPGSLIVEMDQAARDALHPRHRRARPGRGRAVPPHVLEIEARIVEAIGSDAEIALLDVPLPTAEGTHMIVVAVTVTVPALRGRCRWCWSGRPRTVHTGPHRRRRRAAGHRDLRDRRRGGLHPRRDVAARPGRCCRSWASSARSASPGSSPRSRAMTCDRRRHRRRRCLIAGRAAQPRRRRRPAALSGPAVPHARGDQAAGPRVCC